MANTFWAAVGLAWKAVVNWVVSRLRVPSLLVERPRDAAIGVGGAGRQACHGAGEGVLDLLDERPGGAVPGQGAAAGESVL